MNPLRQIVPAFMSMIVLIILCCGVYPLLVWGVSQLAMPAKANGSLIERNGVIVGSTLIGQPFSDPKYFHPRPSAAGNGYDATASGGTNFGPTSAKLLEGTKDDPATTDKDESFAGVTQLVAAYRAENRLSVAELVPADAVTRSGSGLDPHISVANARMQAQRIATARNRSVESVRLAIDANTEGRQLGLLGEPGVNVVRLNLFLDEQR